MWVGYPNLDFLDEAISPKITQGQQEVYASLKKSFTSTQKQVVARIDFQEYRRTLSSLLEAIVAQHADTLLVDPLLTGGGDLMLHCSNVCYLSLMMGVKLGHYLVQQRTRLDPRHARDVMNLGLGALLHDIGKMQLPLELRDYQCSPDKAPPLDWQAHTELGFAMLRGKVEPSASQVALHHHQRWAGSGFPTVDALGTPLARERIHVFTRIVTMADQYERQLVQSNAQGLPPIVAMKTLRSRTFQGMFDPVVFRDVQRPGAAVPDRLTGRAVRRGDGRRVVIHNPDNPCRPVVRRIHDLASIGKADASQPAAEEDVDLANHG